jgi:hypothetical protein
MSPRLRAACPPHNSEGISAYAATIRAEDVRDLPPTFIGVGAPDLFRDEDIAYAQRLMKAGVPTELHVYADGFHGFDAFAPDAYSAFAAILVIEPASCRQTIGGRRVAPNGKCALLIWHFACNPEYMYNVICGLGSVQLPIMWRRVLHQSLAVGRQYEMCSVFTLAL